MCSKCPPVSTFLPLGFQIHSLCSHSNFPWVFGDWTQLLMFGWQTIYWLSLYFVRFLTSESKRNMAIEIDVIFSVCVFMYIILYYDVTLFPTLLVLEKIEIKYLSMLSFLLTLYVIKILFSSKILMWYITFKISNQNCLSRINKTRSWCIKLFIYC